MSNLMHTTREDIENRGIYSVGVKFEETAEEVRKKMIPLLQTLIVTENSRCCINRGDARRLVSDGPRCQHEE